MQKYMKQKFLLILLLSVAVLFIAFPTSGTDLNTSTHRQTIQTFINDIKSLQNLVFTLAQSALEDSPKDPTKLNNQIKFINSEIETLNTRILDYLTTVPSISAQNSDTLLAQNALNLVKNSLYQINRLVNAPSKVDELLILQEFFRLRVNAAETLTGLQAIISSK
ncbi:MAG: hypothetical protein ACRCW2_16630 [Cellulosilyticaceae bacterium]